MIDKTMADLGSVVVGQTGTPPATFVVKNVGSGTSGSVTATVTGDGFTSASTCGASGLAPGAMCNVTVTFKPTSVGSKSGQLSVSATPGGTQTAALTGTGIPVGDLAVSPNLIAFPDTTVGGMSGAQLVTVKNTGGSAVSNVAVALGDTMNFSMTTTCMGSLAGGAQCTASVTFTPKSKGAKSSSLSITGGTQSLTVALSGNGQTAPQLVIQPTAPAVAGIVNQPSPAISFIVGNSGDVDTGTPMVSLTGTNQADFKISSNTCVTPIKGLSTCTVDVVFTPSAEGTRMANLVVSATPGGMVMAPITGTAVIGGTLAITPASPVDLGMVSVGSQSTAKTLTIKNTGGSASGALAVTLASTEFAKGADTCTGVVLAANATCTIDVTVTPTSAGAKSAVLVVSGGAAGQAVVTLTATAAQGATLTASAPSLAFGNAATGTESGAQMVTITNTGAAATGAPNVTLVGSAPNEFHIAGNSCTAALAPAATCSISVTFRPMIAQASTATLQITATPGGTATVTLSGSGTVPGALGVFPSANPAAGLQDFGAIVVNQSTAAPTSFTIKNNGTGPSGTVVVALAGANKDSFTIVSNGCMDVNLAAGATCVVTVNFTPKAVGSPLTATLTASAGGGSGSVVLNGQGLAPVEIFPDIQGDPSPYDHLSASVGTTSTTEKKFWVFVRGALGTITTAVTAGSSDFLIKAGSDNCNNTTAVSSSNALPVYTATGGAVTNINPAVTSGGLFDATLTGAPNNPAGVCHFTTQFKPGSKSAAPGDKTGEVTVTLSGGGSAKVALKGTGVGPLVISPSAYTFTNTAQGDLQTHVFAVKNNGAAPTAGSATVALSGNTGDFMITNNDCDTSLTPVGGDAPDTCRVTVAFQPSGSGAKTVTLTVTATIAAATETGTATITGNGVAAPGITIAPVSGSSATFPTTAIGNTSTVQTFVVTNTGATSTSQIDLAIFQTNFVGGGGDYALTSGCGAALVPGGTCQATITFSPVAGATGTRNALLRGVGNPGGTATLSLTGTATANIVTKDNTDGSTAVTNLDFGVIPVNTASDGKYFRIYNMGSANIAAGSLAFTYEADGAHPENANFVTFDNHCTAALAPAASASPAPFCFFGVQAGANATPGLYTGRLKITGASTKVVALVGLQVAVGANTTQGGVDIVDWATGANVSLGQTFVGQPGPTVRTFTVKNNGGAAGAITVTWDGLAPLPTGLTAGSPNTCATGASLNPGDTCTISVRLTDTATVVVNSVLQVCMPGSGTTQFCDSINVTGTSDLNAAAAVAGTRGLYSNSSVGIFGSYDITPVAAAETQTYTVKNDSAAILTLNANPVYAGAYSGATGTCLNTLVMNPGDTCTIITAFDPTAIGPNLGSVTLTGTIPGPINEQVVIPLIGYGTDDAGAVLSIAPGNPNSPSIEQKIFGDVLAGTAGKSLPFTITNIGSATTPAAVIPAVTNGVNFSVSGCNTTLTAGATCVATVTFAPPVGSVTSGAGNVDLTSNLTATAGALTSNTVGLTGRAVLDALVTFTAGTSLAWPNQYTYSSDNDLGTGGAKNVTVQNGSLGTDRLASRKRTGPLAITTNDPTNIYLNVAGVGCALEETVGLDPGAPSACTFTANYLPQAQDVSLAGTTKVTVAATPGGSLDSTVSGNSIGGVQFDTGGVGTARITTFDFGSHASGSTTLKTFTIENKSTNPPNFSTGLLTFTLDGGGGQFVVTTPATCTTVGSDLAAAGGVCTFSVSFTPTSTGAKTGSLTVKGPPGFTATVALTGTGT